MTKFLLFTLAAPLVSCGAVAVGERRPTWDRPSKSQITGLVAGALGIERADEARQHRLAAGLNFAVRIDAPGRLATDYHTAQVPPARRNRRFATRAEELAVDRTEFKTILSRREFRTGAIYTICLWRREAGWPSLEEIAAALEQPAFVPFAGRKAHALMLPMRPDLVEAATVDAAFALFDARWPEGIAKLWRDLAIALEHERPIFADLDPEAVPPSQFERLEERRDIPESRAKWRFGLRAEALLRRQPAGGGGVQ